MTPNFDDEISYWRTAADEAITKELALVAFGISAGLRMAKELMEGCDDTRSTIGARLKDDVRAYRLRRALSRK